MLHYENDTIRDRILDGQFGLEKESLRVMETGFFSHTLHPFPDDEHIVRDFCENQVEINTPVADSANEAVELVYQYERQVQNILKNMDTRELLWPFSNPPYIVNENDIPLARFDGVNVSKMNYREYLSDKYGRYKMTFSGIHFNYSFSEDLLKEEFLVSGEKDYITFKNRFYLDLAEAMVAYGWLLVAVTAASPMLDSSFVEKGVYGTDTFMGMASVRCSELGYWNSFSPVLDYSDISSYVNSIKRYVDMGLLKAPSELYYPIRLKPKGENTLDNLRDYGVNHIELRMIDLNPLVTEGIDKRDIIFAQLMLIWLSAAGKQHLSEKNQIYAIQNYKNAARYDLKTVKIIMPDGTICSVAQASINIIERMKSFFEGYSKEIQDILDFQMSKFVDANNRYAWIIRKEFGNDYVTKGLKLAKERQEI